MTALAIVPTARMERSDFEELRDRWLVASSAFKKLLQDRDDMILAISMAAVREPHPDAVGLNERAARFMDRARRSPKRLLDDLDDLANEIDLFKPEHARLQATWQAACQTETNRLAKPLMPRHRDAVRRMAVALQDLSIALADEQAVRQELATIAPMPESASLPNMGAALGGLRQSDPKSLGSVWAASARKFGLLE